MLQRPFHTAAIALHHSIPKTALLNRRILFQHPACHGRHQRQRDDKGCHQCKGHGQRQIHKELSGNALNEYDRQKHADRRQRGCSDGAYHLSGTGNRCLNRIGAFGTKPVDIFDDNH